MTNKKILRNFQKSEDVVVVGNNDSLLKPRNAVKADWSTLALSRDVKSDVDALRGRYHNELAMREQDLQGKIAEAYNEGYSKGLVDGAQEERDNRMKSIDALLRDAKSKSGDAIRNTEIKVIDLAVSIAEKIMRQQIRVHPEFVVEMVSEIMSHLVGSETVVLRVSADDFTTVNEKYNTWMSMAGNASEFKIEIDKRHRTGDFIVETEGGVINGVINDRINTIVEELLKIAE